MITPSPPRFGSLLRDYRTAAGLTQEALAERARMSKRGLQDLERGVSQTPRRDTVELLATALGLAADDRAELLAAARPPRRSPARPSRTAAATPNALVPLMGRRRELALLDRFLAGERAPPGSAPVLLLAGEPGIGKSRLLQATAQQAITLGWCVLVGGCYRRGGQEPYAPLLDALAQHLHAASPVEQRAALSGCAWLVRLLPELAELLEPLPGFSLPPEQERRQIFASVTRLLANLAGPSGTLLVLDDLQWAGVDALDLLAALAHTAGLPLRIVGAYRATEVQPAAPLGLLLADLAQAGLVTHTALGPLEAEEAAELLDHLLVGAAVGSAMKEHVVRRADGLPFFLVSHAQALRAGVAEAVPWDLAQSVRQRVALLPGAAQTLLGAAAVMGRQVSRAVLLRATGLAEAALVEGLVAAWRARLLLEEGDDAYVFAHDVVREVVEADLGAAQRAMLHRKVAEALEQDRGAVPAELLAYHYTRAGIQDKAVQHLEQAGDHAWSQRAHAAAEIHYREALDHLERLGRTHDASRLREKLGDVLKWTGRYGAALLVLEPAAETYHASDDLEGLGRVAASIAEADALTGAADEGIARLQPALDRLERGGASASLAALYVWQGIFLLTAGRYDESLAATDRAANAARVARDDRTLVKVAWNRAGTLQLLGRLEEALRADQGILPLAEAVGDLESLISVHRDLAYTHILRGAFMAGERHIEQSFALAEQMGHPAHLALTLAIRGRLATLIGEWRRAHADLDQALAVSRQLGRSWYSPYPLIFLACLSLAEGDREGAATSAQEALALGEWSRDWQALRLASAVMAEIEIMEGRAEAARARLAPLLDRPGLEECDVTALLPVLGWAYLELGQLAQATSTVEQALARARPEDMRLVLVEALRVRAMIALRQGSWDEAAHSLEEGVALARGMPYPHAEARLLRLSAVMHRARGERGRARERFAAAVTIFRRLGASE